MMPDADIAALLEPGERILWQGAPVPGLHRPFRLIGMSAFGLPFLGFGLGAAGFGLWILPGATEWQMGALAIVLLVFALPFIGVGAYLTVGAPLDSLIAAPRRLRYVLTDRRALILSSFPGRRVESWPIVKSSPLVHEPSARAGSVYFHVHQNRDSEGPEELKRAGFENIADSQQVFRLMRQVQQGQTS